MFPAIFLDRDGVLIENRSDYVRDWSHVVFLPNTFEAMASIQDTTFKIIVVTNQSAIGRGLVTAVTVQNINHQMVEVIKLNEGRVDAVYTCPHAPNDLCPCRKPEPGLFFQAARELSIDLGRSWMVGDAVTDLLAAQAAGVNGLVMVRTGRGTSQLLIPQLKSIKDFLVFDDLFDAFKTIKKIEKHRDSGYQST